MTLTTGQLLAQRYRLGPRIAVGGMGEVWEATDTRLDRSVAVKVLKPELSGDAEFRQRFHTEARLTASLNHPGIAAVHDYGETATMSAADTAFLVMELVIGDSLAAILAQHPRLSADRTLDILGQAADALQAAHERGLVHRDIKPGNILLTPTGKVKLTDFGIAKAANTAPVTRQGMVLGTAHYIAPEQAAGAEAGPASDVYALGVVGYECLAGQRPFRSDNAVTVAMMHIRDPAPRLPPDVPSGVRALIEIALAKDPRQRYRTGGEFAVAVAAVRAGYPPPRPTGMTGTAPHPSPHPAPTALLPAGSLSGPSPSGPSPSGRRTTVAMMALLGVLGLVLAGYGIREALRSPESTPGAGTTAAAPEPEKTTPAPVEEPEPTEPDTAPAEPAPEPDDTEEEPADVFIDLTDYLLRSGSVAAATATERGLQPMVVDERGDEIDPEDLAECWITGVDPPFGSLPPGSLLELTCTDRS
ncbi:MAG: serine/threonine-protein kinase [Pseudonocardiaceae bacterium]